MYQAVLATLEASALGQLARGLSWLYPLANLLHVLGAALLVGGIAVFDLAVVLRRDGAIPVHRVALGVAAFGLALQIPTGVVLLSAEATAAGMNPAFLFKLAMIGLGVLNVAVFHLRFGRALADGVLPPSATLYAALSFLAWTLALLAGRAIAYL